jgi:dolichol-phosphate mannosyltransferase
LTESAPLELAVVVPVFNERENIAPLLDCLARALDGIRHEIIFVDDDSPDGTSRVIREIAIGDPRVRVLTRIGRRGLSSACLEGMMATAAPFIAVMDADLQHDERILPEMLAKIRGEGLDLVVGTRNAGTGSMGDFAESRVRLSHWGRRLSRIASRCDLTDPMSGYFVVSRPFVEETIRSTSGIGFKILLDLVAASPRPVRLAEVPYTFRTRLHGESKLDLMVALEYIQLLLDKLVGEWIPPRFVVFAMVGTLGLGVCLTLLFLLVRVVRLDALAAQFVATWIAMTANFFLNNALTYRDRRLRGRRLWLGLVAFYTACAAGVFANLRVVGLLRQAGLEWYLAGVAGLATGAVWNYVVTSLWVWRRGRRNSH